MKKYTTTPLYYVNATPHLGTAYATIMTDGLVKFHKLLGYETRFLTGTDEHGQKIQQAADAKGISPQELTDQVSRSFQMYWADMGIDFDIFYRTTNEKHKEVVSKALDILHHKGDIYSKEYSGWYCVSEETFYAEKDLVNGKTPSGKPVEQVTEKNYFFKMSKYQDQLIKYIENHPKFIQPKSRKNEVLGFLKQPLEDLSISRPKSRVSWGIPIPFDTEQVTYVWVDALLNYAAACGLLQENRKEEFNTWWNEAFVTHIIGKDILTTHAVYWTTLLMALDVKLPDQIFAHGWILNKENEKMSKSFGDIVDPKEIAEVVGIDSLRYYFFSEVHFGKDAPFSMELLCLKTNSDLANNLGNLVSRSFNLINKYFDGKVPALPENSPEDIVNKGLGIFESIEKAILKNQPHEAITYIIEFLNLANQYLEEKAPWKLAKKGDLKEAGESLRVALEVVRMACYGLLPVMPNKCKEILELLGLKAEYQSASEQLSSWGLIKTNQVLEKIKPIFPRVEFEKEEKS